MSTSLTEEVAQVGPDVCVNCGMPGSGAYCAACGQRRGFERHTLRGLARNAIRRVLNVEEGLLHTALLLTTNPGRVVREYIAGRSQRYSNPVGYLLICCALFAGVNQIAGGVTGAGSGNRLFSLLLVPCIAATSRVLFWRYRWNYAEHLILGMYLFGQVVLFLTMVLLISTLFSPATLRASSPLVLAAIILAIALYVCWLYAGAFERKRVTTALGGLAAVVAGATLWVGALVAIVNAVRAVR